MSIPESQKKSAYKYKQNKIKRVPLDMQKSEYEKLQISAESVGMSINGFIKKAIEEKIKREKPE